MASYHVAPLARLVEQFESLPGIGHKSAQRLALLCFGYAEGKGRAICKYSTGGSKCHSLL